MQFSNIIRKADSFIVSYRKKNNVSMVTIPTPFGELLRLFPNKKLLYDTGDFLFYDKKVLSLDYIPINAEYFDEKNCNFQYSPLRGKNRVITLPSQTLYKDYPYITNVSYYFNNSEKSLPDTIREGSIFIDNREVDFINNSYERKIEQLIYKSPDILITCKARDLFSTIQKLFNSIDKKGEWRRDKFYLTSQDYPIYIYPRQYGSILTIEAKNISLGLKACLHNDNLKASVIKIDPSSLAYFADVILPSFKGKTLVYYYAKQNKCIIRNRNKAFVLEGYNRLRMLGEKPDKKPVYDRQRNYSIIYKINDTQGIKNAIQEACSNVYGLGGKKASLNICLDFFEKEILVHSYNRLNAETKKTIVKQEEGINRGYTIEDNDTKESCLLQLSRLYFDANTIQKTIETLDNNDKSPLILSLYDGNKAEFKTDYFNCTIRYKTEKDIQEEETKTREEDVKEIEEQLKSIEKDNGKLCDLIDRQKTIVADAEKSIQDREQLARDKGKMTQENAKEIKKLENKIYRSNNKLYDRGEGRKLIKGLYTTLENGKKEEEKIRTIYGIMNDTSLSLDQSVYAYKRYTGTDNKKRDSKGKIILKNGRPIYKKPLEEYIKNALKQDKGNSLDLSTLVDYEREEQEKTNVSLLLQELEQHKKLLKEEKERAKQEEKERKAREKALREKARQEKKAQEEKAKEEKRLAREKERQAREQAKQEEKENKRIYRKYNPVTYIEDLDKKLDILDNYQPQEIKIETLDYSVPKQYKPYIRRQKTYNKKENNSIYALVGLSLLGSISAAITALVIYLL